jgi:predicted DNA binding CopG/RHH family protein
VEGSRRFPNLKKKLPILKTDEEAEKFVDTVDLSEYDHSVFKKMHFEFKPKDSAISLKLPAELLAL